jgi:hypothetical protein
LLHDPAAPPHPQPQIHRKLEIKRATSATAAALAYKGEFREGDTVLVSVDGKEQFSFSKAAVAKH